jgi:hypothetical protein
MKALLVLAAIVIGVSAIGEEPAHFWARLLTSPSGTYYGLCLGRYLARDRTFMGGARILRLACTHDIVDDPAQDLTAAHLHGPAGAPYANTPGTFLANGLTVTVGVDNGAPIYAGTTGVYQGFVIADEATEKHLFNGNFYVNVHSLGAPGGLVRGQLWPFGHPRAPVAAPQGPAPEYVAWCNTQQAAITPNNDTQIAIAFLWRGRTTAGTWDIEWAWNGLAEGDSNIQYAHVHLGNVGISGAVQGTICDRAGSAGGTCTGNAGSGLRYTAANSLPWATDPTAAVMDAAGTYVNIHTDRHGGGQVRGQITRARAYTRFNGDDTPNFYARLSGSTTTCSTARGFAAVYYEAASRMIRVYTTFNLVATAAHVHGPASLGFDAPPPAGVVWGLTGNLNGFLSFVSSGPISAMAESWLYNGLLYVNIHSTAFPDGEIRGQIQRWDATGAPTHVALLNEIQAGTVAPGGVQSNTRGGLAWFDDCPSGSTTCMGNFQWAGLSAVAAAAHIHDFAASSPANPASTGPVVDICGGSRPACADGAAAAAANHAALAITGSVVNGAGLTRYVAVHVGQSAAVEIRGQIQPMGAVGGVFGPRRWSDNMDQANYYAIANGQISVVAGGTGLCSVTYNSLRAELYYTCTHTCAAANLGHFHGPCTGAYTAGASPCTGNFNSGVRWTLTQDATNQYMFKGTITGVTAQDVTDLNQNRFYFNVHNANNPGGCTTGVLWQVGQGPNSPTHSAVCDSAQSGFAPAPALADANYKPSAIGVALFRRTAANTYNSWLHWSGQAGDVTNAHIHAPTLVAPITWHPEDIGPGLVQLSYTAGTTFGNTTDTGLTPTDTNMDTGRSYVNLHMAAPFGNGVIRGAVVPTLALPVGTPTTTRTCAGSSTGVASSTGNPASTVVASFFMVAILALVAVLFQ